MRQGRFILTRFVGRYVRRFRAGQQLQRTLLGKTFKPAGEIGLIYKTCRLIKGQVFLWKDGQT